MTIRGTTYSYQIFDVHTIESCCVVVTIFYCFFLVVITVGWQTYKQSHVLCFLLRNSPASECYMPTFRNTLFHLHRQVGVERLVILHLPTYEDITDSVFRNVGI